MTLSTRALSILLGLALSAPAFADDAVVGAPIEPVVDTAVVETAIVANAKLDAAVVEQAAASEAELGLPPQVLTGIIFFTIGAVLFTVATDGNNSN